MRIPNTENGKRKHFEEDFKNLSDEADSESHSTIVATKKRLRYYKEKRQALKERGQEYVNSVGKIIRAKKILPNPCKEKCQKGFKQIF